LSQREIKTHVRRPQTETAACAKAPHEDQKVLEEQPAQAHPHPREYIHPLVQLKREGIGDNRRDVRFRAHRIARNRSGAMHAAEEHQDSKMSAAKLAKHRADVRHARSLLEMSRYYGRSAAAFRTS